MSMHDWLLNHLRSRTQVFILSSSVNSTGSWSEMKEKWKHRHSAQVMWPISSNSCMFVSVMSKRLKPMKISTENVCKKLKWKKTFKTPKENQSTVTLLKYLISFFIVNWARCNHFLKLLKTQLAAAQTSLSLQLLWKHRKAASLSRGKVQWSTFLIGKTSFGDPR